YALQAMGLAAQTREENPKKFSEKHAAFLYQATHSGLNPRLRALGSAIGVQAAYGGLACGIVLALGTGPFAPIAAIAWCVLFIGALHAYKSYKDHSLKYKSVMDSNNK